MTHLHVAHTVMYYIIVPSLSKQVQRGSTLNSNVTKQWPPPVVAAPPYMGQGGKTYTKIEKKKDRNTEEG